MALKRHIMGGVRPDGSGFLYDPISDTVADPAGIEASDPGSAIRYYFRAPSRRPAFNWELTLACSWHCGHCFQNTEPAPEGFSAMVSEDLVERAIDVLRASKAEEVSITGGEPLLVRDLGCILEQVRARLPDTGIRVLASGCGVLARPWMDNTIESLRSVGATVRIPLYGGTERVHARVTRTARSLADIVDLAHALRRSGVPVTVGVGVFRETAGCLAETLELASQLATAGVAITTMIYPAKGPTAIRPSALRRVEPSQLMRMLTWPQTAALATQYLSLEPNCESGCHYPTIARDGTLHACDVLSWPVKSEDLLSSPAIENAEGCADCEYVSVCRRCAAIAHGTRCDDVHRVLVAACAYVVGRRADAALSKGLSFVDAEAIARFAPFMPTFRAAAYA